MNRYQFVGIVIVALAAHNSFTSAPPTETQVSGKNGDTISFGNQEIRFNDQKVSLEVLKQLLAQQEDRGNKIQSNQTIEKHVAPRNEKNEK